MSVDQTYTRRDKSLGGYTSDRALFLFINGIAYEVVLSVASATIKNL